MKKMVQGGRGSGKGTQLSLPYARSAACLFGIGEIKKPVQPVGEPSRHTSRRRAFVDAAGGDKLTRRLALGEGAAQLMRYLRPRLQNGRQILLRQFVGSNRYERLKRHLRRVPGQHADLAEMIARSDAEELHLSLGHDGRQ